MRERQNRSSHYQSLFAETTYSHDMLSSFSNEDSISARLNPFEYDERLIELEEELRIEFWKIVNSELTDRQRDVIRLYADGYTQCEIAKKLSVNQSSVAKNLSGNVQYDKENGTRKFFGGSKKRLNKIIDTNEKILLILRKMAELRSEKW
jgi:DNA-directed RNA polymerase specialized sigma24 family protein